MQSQIHHILENITSQGYRSNATKPLIAIMVICAIACILTWRIEAFIISFVMAGMTIICCILFFIAYFICLCKDPNLLRSERFNLEKIALEKAYSQDSINGNRIAAKAPKREYIEVIPQNIEKE